MPFTSPQIPGSRPGQEDRQGDGQHHLPQKGKQRGLHRLAQGLQENKGRLVDTVQDHHAKIHPESQLGKVEVQRAVVGAEDTDKLYREHLKKYQGHGPHRRLRPQQQPHHLPAAAIAHGAVVEAYHGNAACRHAHHHGDDDLVELHHDAQHRHGNGGGAVRRKGRYCPVPGHHVVHSHHGQHQGELAQKAGKAQGNELGHQLPPHQKTLPGEMDELHPEEISQGNDGGDDLSRHRGHGSPRHSPVEAEDGNGIQHHIGGGPGHRGRHSQTGRAVGADDGVHSLAEHIHRNARADPEEILPGILPGGAVQVVIGPKEPQDLVVPEEIHRRQHQSRRRQQRDDAGNGISAHQLSQGRLQQEGILLFHGVHLTKN